jgi:hypothetical protein
MSESQVQALWTTAKAQLATITADFTTLQNDLATMEALRVQLAAAGGSGVGVGQWLATQIRQLGAGWLKYVNSPEPPPIITVYAPNPGSPRDLSQLGDVRPITWVDQGLS